MRLRRHVRRAWLRVPQIYREGYRIYRPQNNRITTGRWAVERNA